MPVDVFISYRGTDRVLARKLERRLRSRWGSRVFRDETSLMAGLSWAEQLVSAMQQAKVTLALIGPGWHIRAEGEDWVRDELLGAIEAGNPVLPVLVGDTDKRKQQLGELPEAFQKQAVNISRDLAGFDLHKIETALRNLGAFGDRRSGGLRIGLSDTLPDRCKVAVDNLLDGKSLLISGASGSGRKALLERIAQTVKDGSGLVTAHGIDPGARSRRTHSIIASWIDGLCELHADRPSVNKKRFGTSLINAVLQFGPDLLARQVLRVPILLPLGDDESDQRILDAAQRSTDRWAPFPPERLVSQSVGIIANFATAIDDSLTLIVDNIESLDGSSKNLIRRLLRSPNENIRLVLATSTVSENPNSESSSQIIARALEIDEHHGKQLLGAFDSISLHDTAIWGEPGVVINEWLNKHHVKLEENVSKTFNDSNPYYALSALWFLVDNGHIVEKIQPDRGEQDTEQTSDEDEVTWVFSRPDEPPVVPDRGRLLDHMIEEFIPLKFRSLIETGSLMGRRFLFSAAHAVAHPPESVDGQAPGSEALKRWRSSADRFWEQLKSVDPDGSVIVCHLSVDNERMINFAQFGLVSHLAGQLSETRKRFCHRQLAAYFQKPIASDVGRSLDDKYRNSRAAAHHWTSAKATRKAADAERIAAGLAETVLAYPEARQHYKRSIRLFTQLLTNKKHRATLRLVDHQDMLILANCLYLLGQMTRLANVRDTDRGSSEPIKYFEQALERLRKLSLNLHDKRLVAPTSRRSTTNSLRDLPEPNLIRHHIRLCETLSGRIKLELAELKLETDPKESRDLLFDALRHAESARGESDSRWLLAATSVQLAETLVHKAIDVQQRGNTKRSHNLSIEAQFHIERVIGLAAVSPDEDRNLEEPRSRAWTVLGKLFQTVELDPNLAQWSYDRMNDHRYGVSDLDDMVTDHRLGLFLLSKHRGVSDAQTVEARKLLERHMKWAIESGIAYEQSDACVSLALFELAQQSQQIDADLDQACMYVENALESARHTSQKRDAYLLRGLLYAIENASNGGVSHDNPKVLQSFRNAGINGTCSTSNTEDVLSAGWKMLLIKLLRWCPHVEDWVGVNVLKQAPPMRDESALSRHRFFSGLFNAEDGELRGAMHRATTYLELTKGEILFPSSDAMLWRLLKCRVPSECYEHAENAKAIAHEMFNEYCTDCGKDPSQLNYLISDIEYAIAVHEWYRSTDPSRLITLARESNMQIDGHEWASPKLLSGRLALNVLDRQYGAANEIGQQRFRRIRSIITNWVSGSRDAGYCEQIFYVAVQELEPKNSPVSVKLTQKVKRTLSLNKAYEQALKERQSLVHQAGLPLVQDLHLFDAKNDLINASIMNPEFAM